MNKAHQLIIFMSIFALLNACSSDRYKHKHDSTPTRTPSQAELKDAIPRAEPYSRGGNKNYEVWGKSYQVLNSAQGFEQTGTASWYGKKFHGHLTSNGEIYDMYTMTAAHKNLPLPTYLKVTNLANNKTIIVRVNDRGPFHESRIVDLSYSAAYKLDMLKTGTAQVKITAITDFDPKTGLVKPTPVEKASTKLPLAAGSDKDDKNLLAKGGSTNLPITRTEINIANDTVKSPVVPAVNGSVENKLNNSTSINTQASKQVNMGIATPYIQVLVTSKKELAVKIAAELNAQYKQNTSYPEQEGLYRIQLGPIDDLATLNALLNALKKNGYPNAYPRTAQR